MILVDIVSNRCPRCKSGHVFKSNNLFSYKKVEMHKKCPQCELNFTKEPGFYWGSMYVSYALAMGEGALAYLICRLLGTDKFDPLNLWIIIATMLVFSPYNYRLARLVWLYILPGK